MLQIVHAKEKLIDMIQGIKLLELECPGLHFVSHTLLFFLGLY